MSRILVVDDEPAIGWSLKELLSDEGHEVAEAYGVWGERTVGDRTFTGTFRVTFLINPQGRVARVWGSVTPTGHAAEVLAEIEAQRA